MQLISESEKLLEDAKTDHGDNLYRLELTNQVWWKSFTEFVMSTDNKKEQPQWHEPARPPVKEILLNNILTLSKVPFRAKEDGLSKNDIVYTSWWCITTYVDWFVVIGARLL